MTIDDISDNFALLDDWDDRYRYVIELGRTLDPLPDGDHNAATKVQGCASQVWLVTDIVRNDRGDAVMTFRGDSDAHIVRGLIAILFALYGGLSPQAVLAADAVKTFDELGFADYLTPQRSNGLRAMVERVRSDARKALAGSG